MPAARSLPDSAAPEPPSVRWQLPHGLAAFRHRDYRILWSVQAGSLTGNWMQSLAQSWLVLTMTGSPLHLALINVCQFGPALLFGLPAGVIADRYPKRSVMLVTQSVAGILTAFLALTVLTGTIQLWQIYAVASGVGIVMAFSNPARQAFVVDVVGKEDLINAVALNSALFNATRVLGPAIAGVLLAQVGVAVCFLVNAVAYVPVVLGLAVLRARGNPEPDTEGHSPWRRLRDGLAYVRRTPEVFRPIVMIGIIGTFGMNFSVWMPLLAVQLGAGAEGFGWLMSALGVGSLTGALGVAFFGRTMGRRALLIAPVLFGVFEVGLAALAGLPAPMALVLPAATITGFAVSTTMSMSNTTIQSLVPNALRGRVSSIFMTVFMGSVPIGALISGTTSSLFGTPGSVAFGGTVVLVSGVIAAISGFGRRPRLAAPPLPASSVSPLPATSVRPRSGAGGDD